jgi:hypothetical protein
VDGGDEDKGEVSEKGEWWLMMMGINPDFLPFFQLAIIISIIT